MRRKRSERKGLRSPGTGKARTGVVIGAGLLSLAGCGRIDFGISDANHSIDAQPSPYAEAVRSDGPIAYWRFEEASGQVAIDEIGDHHATFTGTVMRGAGVAGQSSLFDGKTTRLVVGDVFAFSGTVPYSIECWIMPTLVDDQVRFLVDRSALPVDSGYQVYFADTFTLVSRSVEDSEYGYAWAPPPVAGRWTHLVVTYDGQANAIYSDGVLQNSSPAPAMPVVSGGRFIIGDLGTEQFYKYVGGMDEVAVYDRVLTAEQVAQHAAVGRQ